MKNKNHIDLFFLHSNDKQFSKNSFYIILRERKKKSIKYIIKNGKKY